MNHEEMNVCQRRCTAAQTLTGSDWSCRDGKPGFKSYFITYNCD